MVDNNKFESESRKLDNKIHELIGQLTSILPQPINELPLFQGFQEHLMYVIMSFLGEENTGGSPQELFIQIPINKFANIDETGENKIHQDACKRLNGAIVACLMLSTIDKYYNDARVSEDLINDMSGWSEDNNSDKIGSAIYCEYDGASRVIEFKTWKKRRPRRDALYTLSPLSKITYWGYKTKPNFKIIPKTSFKEIKNAYQVKRNKLYVGKQIIKDMEQLKKLVLLKKNLRQYINAALVHVGKNEPLNENLPIGSCYFNSIPLYRNIDELSKSLGKHGKIDVIIAVGDDRYKNQRQSYRDCASQKIVYIGTESPGDDIPVYSFSLREMHRYCSSDGTRFEEPHMVRNISFSWMDETLGKLEIFLNNLSEGDENLTNDVKRSIIRNLRTRFSNIDFCHDSWEEQKDNIEFDIDCNPDTMDSIKEWCENLNYPEISNPKVEEIRKLEVQPTLVFAKYWGKHLRYDDSTQMYVRDRSVDHSYIKEYKTLSNIHNHIVLDSASYSNGQNEAPIYKAYMHLMKYHLYAYVTALYYTCEDNYAKALLRYLSKEFDSYQSEKRIAYGTSILRDDISDSTIVELPDEDILFTLEDFMDANDSSDSWSVSESKQIIVSFRDGHQDRIDGDVLIKSGNGYERTRIQLLEDRDFHDENIEIVYYVNPEEFERYMMAQFIFKEGLDICYYENMWKKALRDYVSKGNRQSLVEHISSRTNIAQDTIKRYLNENCQNKFLGSGREMRKLCAFLSSEGYNLSEDLIVNAKKANDSNKKNGKKLKKEVLDYRMNPGNSIPTIRTISKRLNLTVDEIVDSCLSTGVISNIEIN